jgi:hypothetical chaperone protein
MRDDKSSTFAAPLLTGVAMRFDRAADRVNERAVGIGIDFGTTNSAAAIFDGKQVSVVRLEDDSEIMPSACYIDRDFTVCTGTEAIGTYVESNRGRRVEFRVEVLGEARTSTGYVDTATGLPSTAETETIYGKEHDDAGLPGRLFHGIKRLLGARDSERVVIFGRPFRLVALITPILVRIREAIDRTTRQVAGSQQATDLGGDERDTRAMHACIGHPVRFEGGDAGGDRRALKRLGETCRYAGVVEQTFCPEPIAAAIAHLHANPPAGHMRVLAVDFGGGTLDLCVIRCRDASLEVESIHGIALGGNAIDQAIYRVLLFPLLGKGRTWRRVVEGRPLKTEFPFWIYEDRLLNWQVTYTLNQNRYTTPLLDQIRQGDESAKPFERLYHLIAQNYGYETFRAVRTLKEQLSYQRVGVLDIPELDVHVELTRDDFERLIADEIGRFEDAIDATLANARLEPDEIDLVLRTGGSALIPAFADILMRRFPAKIVEQDPFTSVAAGLAIADYYALGQPA